MDQDSQNVIVTGIKIPFFSLMMFMIKWTLASIPAIIVGIALWVGIPIAIDTLGVADMVKDVPILSDLLRGNATPATPAPPP